jgi:hypothetical protein
MSFGLTYNLLKRPPLGARRQQTPNEPAGAAVDELGVDPGSGRGRSRQPAAIRAPSDAGLGAVIKLDQAAGRCSAQVRYLHPAQAAKTDDAARKRLEVHDWIFAAVLLDSENSPGLPQSQTSGLSLAVDSKLAAKVAGDVGRVATSDAGPVQGGHEKFKGGATIAGQVTSGLVVFAVVVAEGSALGFPTIVIKRHISNGSGAPTGDR